MDSAAVDELLSYDYLVTVITASESPLWKHWQSVPASTTRQLVTWQFSRLASTSPSPPREVSLIWRDGSGTRSSPDNNTTQHSVMHKNNTPAFQSPQHLARYSDRYFNNNLLVSI